jgi:hypothetical protein
VKLPIDIEQYIARAFAQGDRAQALALVSAAVVHDGRPAGARLMRCALLSSGGTLAGLRRQIEQLKFDYRDVIVEGEYVPEGAKLVRIRDLNQPIDSDSGPEPRQR